MLQGTNAIGRSGAAYQISGLSTVNNLVVLRNLFTQIKPKRTLEIGFAYGASTLLFTASHRDMGHHPAHQHTAIDPYQTQDYDEAGLIALEGAGLREYLDFRPTFSSVALPQLMADKSRFELIYVDGLHLFEDVFVDFYFTARLLADGGVVAFDYSTVAHVKKVLKFINANWGFAYQPLDLGPYRPDGGLSIRYKIAKTLGRTQLTAFRKIGPLTRKWNSPFIDF
jgi:cephalosporin hydroxylase